MWCGGVGVCIEGCFGGMLVGVGWVVMGGEVIEWMVRREGLREGEG